MKIKICFLSAFGVMATVADELRVEDKKAFAEFYRSFVDLRKDFPDELDVHVLFMDLNQDGKLDALAASRGDKYEDGWDWCAFCRDPSGKWIPVKGVDEMTGKPVIVDQIFARRDEFHRLKKADAPAPILKIRQEYWKGQRAGEAAFHIMFNVDGALELKKSPMPEKKKLENYEPVEAEIFKE